MLIIITIVLVPFLCPHTFVRQTVQPEAKQSSQPEQRCKHGGGEQSKNQEQSDLDISAYKQYYQHSMLILSVSSDMCVSVIICIHMSLGIKNIPSSSPFICSIRIRTSTRIVRIIKTNFNISTSVRKSTQHNLFMAFILEKDFFNEII